MHETEKEKKTMKKWTAEWKGSQFRWSWCRVTHIVMCRRSILKSNRTSHTNGSHHVKIETAYVISNSFEWRALFEMVPGAIVDEKKTTQIFAHKFQRRTAALHTDFDAWLINVHRDLDCLVRRLRSKMRFHVFNGIMMWMKKKNEAEEEREKLQTLNPWNSF